MDEYEIVKRLEYCINNQCDICQEENGSGFPWVDGRCYGFTERVCDVIALLKEQQPRVMTLEEVITHYSLPPVFVDDLGAQEDYYEDIQPLYFEFLHDKEYPWMVHWIGHTHVTMCLNEWKHTYNKKWRCWTSRPTDEQREETPWDVGTVTG